MTRQILIAIGIVLLTIGGTGIIVGLAWLTASKVQGTLPYILDQRTETLLYIVPALLLVVALVGAQFVAAALCAPPKESRASRNLHPHMRFHA